MALNDLGYRAIGIRIDSGDLAYLSKVAREAFVSVGKQFDMPWFPSLTIVASNDINEDTILSLNDQGHAIDCFGIGTHLGTNILKKPLKLVVILICNYAFSDLSTSAGIGMRLQTG